MAENPRSMAEFLGVAPWQINAPAPASAVDQWADRICIQVGKTAESIIEIGRLLLKAKADLPFGEWEKLFEEQKVPFGVGSAQRFMAIAEHPLLAAHAPTLPPSWYTLYELTKVEPKRLTAAFEEGAVTPDMTRGEVKALRKRVRKPSKTARAPLLPQDQQGQQVMPEISTEKLQEIATLMAEWAMLPAKDRAAFFWRRREEFREAHTLMGHALEGDQHDDD